MRLPNPNIKKHHPCWCGSNRQYKKCHMNREQQTPLTMQEKLNHRRQAYGKEYCLHAKAGSECSSNIIRAHTIQRNGGLSKIAKDGHVYNFIPDEPAMLKDGPASLAPRLLGLKKASTFTGFCGYHDKTTFAPIEDHPFQSTHHHAFLLAYRAICKEIFLKEANWEDIPLIRLLDKGRDIEFQIGLQNDMDLYGTGVKAAINEMTHYKSLYDAALIKSDYTDVQYYIVNTSSTPDFLCSGAFLPEYDFAGNKLQDLMIVDRLLEQITFSIIPTDNGGAVVFSWIGKSEVGTKFLKTLHLLTDQGIPDAIARFTFEHFENTFVSPIWWDGLPSSTQKALMDRQLSGTVVKERTAQSLKDDGVRSVSWLITSRDTNIDFSV